MKEKNKYICPSCGQEIEREGVKNGENIYCEKCRSPQTKEKTITLEEKPVEKAEVEGQTTLKLGKTVAATKIIKEVLKIEPDVDLEQASKIYFGRDRDKVDSEAEPSISNLISSAGEAKYLFDKEIGHGGMGVVLETVDQDIRRKVAMKVMPPSTKENIPLIKRFLEEAQITGQLEHPNIVPVHEIGIDDESTAYFTMKLVRGEDLEAIISKMADGNHEYLKKYSLGSLIQIFMKVCDGIGYAHSKGVLHRDLKPENIMVGSFGEVLVMDWGVSKVLGREEMQTVESSMPFHEKEASFQTIEGQVMGTPSYMSPEQAMGNISELDERSDVFSLGGILYKILTYQAPYKGESGLDKLDKARGRMLVPPDLRAPDNQIPPELNAICMKAMARDKENRYANALELKNDLQLYLDGKSVSAKKDNLLIRAKKWIIRNKVASMGIAAAVICLVIGIVLTAMYGQKKKQETIANLLNQGQQASVAARYEEAEETFFSVLGLDRDNIQARKGISLVSGKALALKNKRLAKEKVKEANTLFENKDYIKAYDAYVSTFALDPDSKEARQGIKVSALMAEKQKAQKKIAPIILETKNLTNRKKEIDKSIAHLTAKVEKLKSKIKGYEGFGVKKPLWATEKTLLSTKIDNLKIESKIISKYITVISHDGQNKEARNALAQIYYNKYNEAETLQNIEEMAYFKELILTFDDGYYKNLLKRDGTLTLTSTPKIDAYYIYRFIEGPDRRMIPAPFRPAAFFTARKNSVEDKTMQGIDPEFKLSKAAFTPIQKILTFKNYNLLKQIDRLRLPSGSYLIILKKKGCLDTRTPVLIKRGEDKTIESVKILKKRDVPEGFVYIPKGKSIIGGDPSAPYSVERTKKFIPGFLISRNEITVKEYLKFINYLEARIPGSAEKYLPRKAPSSGFYWKKSGSRYKSTFPLDWPVLGISWNDARAYCKWMGLQYKDKKWKFRLPEDWEWEKAARGVDGRFFPWGNYFDYRFCSMANSKKGKRNGPDKIGSFPLDESVFGVRDIAGNISEWCQTFFDQEKNIRINRGSAWSYVDEDYARCAGRNGHSPTDVADFRGFRMAVSLKK